MESSWQINGAARGTLLDRASSSQTVQPAIKPSEAMVRHSPRMLELARMIERLAPRRISVLILGETGTGKELIARELHNKSDRKHAPLQTINCGAIPQQLITSVLFGHVRGSFTGALRDQEGVFAQADGGTVFLDEVGELSAEAQAALLRVLDTHHILPVGGKRERRVDVRVVAATHRNLAEMAAQGSFRLDLYHRLSSIVVQLPPLRERKEEILPLAQHFLERFEHKASLPRLSEQACARLQSYNWPGNVRELRNVIERAVALCEQGEIRDLDLPDHMTNEARETADQAHRPRPLQPCAALPQPAAAEEPVRSPEVPPTLPSPIDLRRILRDHEIALIKSALRTTHGNQRLAAALLQIPLRTLERKLRILGIRDRKAP